MTNKDIYISGRAEYLHDVLGYTLSQAIEIATIEWGSNQQMIIDEVKDEETT